MKVFRGRLVHSVDAHQEILVLEDHLIGVQDRDEGGKVSWKKLQSAHQYFGDGL